MSTIKSSTEHLTLNADGASKDIKFQANGVEKASISSAGAFTSTSIDATKLTGALPAIDGSALTGDIGLGTAQTWTNVLASRSDNTTYTNSTGRTIFVSVGGSTWGQQAFFINGVQICQEGINITSAQVQDSTTYPIPDGNTYKFRKYNASSSIWYWFELR